jgi:hypothetical protein
MSSPPTTSSPLHSIEAADADKVIQRWWVGCATPVVGGFTRGGGGGRGFTAVMVGGLTWGGMRGITRPSFFSYFIFIKLTNRT